MDQSLVTVALPSFNAEETVGDAIASIILQTYWNWELLLIDDGSSDQTVAIAKSFKDPRIKIFADGTNRGLPARLNEAIDRSSGKYFARMDNDDICFPERLQRQVEYLEAHENVDLLGTRAITFITPWQVTGFFPFKETHEGICSMPWRGFYLPHPTWMGKLEWFKNHRYCMPEVKRAEDQELLLRNYPTSRFACLPEVLFAYRLRDKISLKINMVARKSLLLSQIRLFGARAQWGYIVMAMLSYAVKCVNDFYISLIGNKTRQSNIELADELPRWEELKSKIAQLQR